MVIRNMTLLSNYSITFLWRRFYKQNKIRTVGLCTYESKIHPLGNIWQNAVICTKSNLKRASLKQPNSPIAYNFYSTISKTVYLHKLFWNNYTTGLWNWEKMTTNLTPQLSLLAVKFIVKWNFFLVHNFKNDNHIH